MTAATRRPDWTALGLLPARLGRPRTLPAMLGRPHLDAFLDAAARHPLTLVIAPAGAGKTAALAAWAARASQPVGFWTVDDETASPRWLPYFLAALASARPDLTPPQWPGPAADPIAWLAEHVVLPLSRSTCPIVLVLDEIERATDPAFWRALAWLLDHRPDALRLVLAGRTPPPLPLARLEAAGILARLHADALKFAEAEAAELAARIAGRELDASTRAWLYARTEGWPAGVRLLAHGLAARPTAPHDRAPIDRRALEFLAEEVLARQPEPRREFLLATAIADELHPDLCAALSGRADAGDELWRLVDEGLFVAPIDGRDGEVWLRHHPLFRAMLRSHLSARPGPELAALHACAARWYAARGRLDRAVEHCERAGDPDLAGELAAAHGFSLVRLRALGELGRLVELAARAGLDGRLATLAAWAALPRGPVHARAAIARAREALAPHDGPLLHVLTGSLDCLEAFMELRGGSPERGLEQARRVLAVLGPDARGLAIALHLAAGLAAELLQRLPDALSHFESAATAAAVAPAMPSLLPAQAHRIRILRRLGRLDDAGAIAAAADTAAATHGWSDTVFVGEVALERAAVLHARAALADAEDLVLAALVRLRLGDDRGDVVRGAALLARIRRDRGDLAGARDAAEEAVAAASELEPWLRALAAIELEPTTPPPTGAPPLVRTAARLAAADSALHGSLDPDGSREHLSALADEQREAAATGRALDRIAAGVVRAALLAAADPDRAARDLEDMSLQAHGYRLPFVRHAARLRPLLPRLTPPARSAALALLGDPAPAADDAVLSAREREVLAAIALGLSNQLIARRLFVSLATVKTHIHNILHKLAVDNRTAAVRRGRDLGLLPDD